MLNGELLFNGTNAAGHLGLWETDGTAAGTASHNGTDKGFYADMGESWAIPAVGNVQFGGPACPVSGGSSEWRVFVGSGYGDTAANVNEVTQALDVLVNKPAVGGKPGPKRELPERLQGDRGYDSEPLRELLRWLGITPVLAKHSKNFSIPDSRNGSHALAVSWSAASTEISTSRFG